MSDQLQAALEACRVPCPTCGGTHRLEDRGMLGVTRDCPTCKTPQPLTPAVLVALRAVVEACEVTVLTGRAECCCERIGPKCEWCLRSEIVADIRDLKESIK